MWNIGELLGLQGLASLLPLLPGIVAVTAFWFVSYRSGRIADDDVL
jgi:hypothetical protein